MKKTDVLYGSCWVMFIGGFFLDSVKIKEGVPISILSLATIAIIDWVRLKKENAMSNEIHYLDFKMLFCEIASCLALLFIFIWEILHSNI